MNTLLKYGVPLATLLCACGSSDVSSQAERGGETTSGSGGTSTGSGSASATTGGFGTSGDTVGTGTGTTGVTGAGSTGTGSVDTGPGATTSGSASASTTTGAGVPTGGGVGTTTGGSGPSTTTGAGGAGGGGGAGGSTMADAGNPDAPDAHESDVLPLGQQARLTAGAWDDNRNFEWFNAYRIAYTGSQPYGVLPIAAGDFAAAQQAAAQATAQPVAHQKLDIALVIDTTGSMGDELSYLQSEFLSISSAVNAKYPNAQTRWSLVAYRDVGDAYVTRAFDFSDDPQAFQVNLANQSADGGGDFPESPERGLGDMAAFGWRTGADAARLAFWVADAPHHAEKAQAMAAVLGLIRTQGIHVYPVASSGVDELTELTMRSAAQLTLGRYLFLTDDSRIGNSHKEPTIPCYFVTALDSAIQRVVDIEMTGVYRAPDASEIIRRGGDPQNGACSLGQNRMVVIF